MENSQPPPEPAFPEFAATHFYSTWVFMQVSNPQKDGHQKLLSTAYALYARLRARHQIQERANGDGGQAMPTH